MRRIIVLFFAVVLLVAVSSCSTSRENNDFDKTQSSGDTGASHKVLPQISSDDVSKNNSSVVNHGSGDMIQYEPDDFD